MPNYRIYQINGAGRIVDGHVAACPGDEDVKAVARSYLGGHAAVEVWLDRRRVVRLARAGAETPGASSNEIAGLAAEIHAST